MVICTACLGKIVGTVAVSLMCRVPFQEALALGFLMNTKGLVELIVLNIGKDRGVCYIDFRNARKYKSTFVKMFS